MDREIWKMETPEMRGWFSRARKKMEARRRRQEESALHRRKKSFRKRVRTGQFLIVVHGHML